MKVHHLINVLGQSHGGAEKIALELHHGLIERQIQSQVVAVKQDGEVKSTDFVSLNHRSPYAVSAVLSFRKYIRKNCEPGDIIHTHLFPSNLFASLAVRISGWKGILVTTEHSTHNRRRGTIWGRIVDTQTYRRYDRVFCISEGTRQSLASWRKPESDRMFVVNNGTPLVFQSNPYQVAKGKRNIILSMGRLHTIKNYESAIRALTQLKTNDFEYWIAGSGAEQMKLKQLTEELGLVDRVRFLGYVENPKELLLQADLFLITSHWEGFGLSVVEAMNAGIPVIASDVPGLGEVIGDSNAGCLVEPTNETQIASEIQRLLEDDNSRLEMSKAGFERAKQFSADSMVDAYIDQYSELAGEKIST